MNSFCLHRPIPYSALSCSAGARYPIGCFFKRIYRQGNSAFGHVLIEAGPIDVDSGRPQPSLDFQQKKAVGFLVPFSTHQRQYALCLASGIPTYMTREHLAGPELYKQTVVESFLSK